MSLGQEASQSREVNTLPTGTAIGAIPEEGALLVPENIQTTTRVTERVSQAAEVVTKAAEMGVRAPLKEMCNHSSSSADPLTLADGATHHTLYVDATVHPLPFPPPHAPRGDMTEVCHHRTSIMEQAPSTQWGQFDMLNGSTTQSHFNSHIVVNRKVLVYQIWTIFNLSFVGAT